MREKQKQSLQNELGVKVLARIVKIQRWVRAKMLRCRFLHQRRSAITIQVRESQGKREGGGGVSFNLGY